MFMWNVNHVESEKMHSHVLFLSSTESVFRNCSTAPYNVWYDTAGTGYIYKIFGDMFPMAHSWTKVMHTSTLFSTKYIPLAHWDHPKFLCKKGWLRCKALSRWSVINGSNFATVSTNSSMRVGLVIFYPWGHNESTSLYVQVLVYAHSTCNFRVTWSGLPEVLKNWNLGHCMYPRHICRN